MISEYEVITSRKLADLQDRVRERIGEGWQPIGGIAAVHEEAAGDKEPHMVFAQAVVTMANGTSSKA
jgi:hypothetical protein